MFIFQEPEDAGQAVRQILRQHLRNEPSLKLTLGRTASEQEAYEIGEKLDEEEMVARSNFNCSICLETKEIHGSYSLDCSHRLCAECIFNHVTSKVRDKKVSSADLTCPSCKEPILPV